MNFDLEKIQQIRSEYVEKGYYAKRNLKFTLDKRGTLNFRDLVASHFQPHFHVLDVGCGDAQTLRNNYELFAKGVGIDNHPQAIEDARVKSADMPNLEYVLCQSIHLPHHFKKHSFDVVFSERGPLSGSNQNIQAAVNVLKPDGVIITETPGERNEYEVHQTFGFPKPLLCTTRDHVVVLFERNGIDIRFISEVKRKIIFEDIYEWIKYYYSQAADGYVPMLTAHELLESLPKFYKECVDEKGQIGITQHRVWVTGVRQKPQIEFWEHQFYDDCSIINNQ